MSDTAKNDVLVYVTKYGFEYVLSANMYWSRQLNFAVLERTAYAGQEIRTCP